VKPRCSNIVASGGAPQASARAQRLLAQAVGQGGNEPLRNIAQGRAGAVQLVQIGIHRAHRRGDGHVVVVQNDEQPPPFGPRIVQRLIGHASGDGPVTNNRNRVARGLAHVAANGEPQRGRDRGRGMRSAERVKHRLGAFGETGNPAFLPQGGHLPATARQDFVRVALMAHIPDQLVERGAKDGMNGHGQFHHTKRRPQMPACAADDLNCLGPQFGRQIGQFQITQIAQIGGTCDAVQKRRVGAIEVNAFHGLPPMWSQAPCGSGDRK
jgi:hypothetical protein